jgi:hypothetical protein
MIQRPGRRFERSLKVGEVRCENDALGEDFPDLHIRFKTPAAPWLAPYENEK